MKKVKYKTVYDVPTPGEESKIVKKKRTKENTSIFEGHYGTVTGDDDYDIVSAMPAELDLFSNIPEKAYENPHFRRFVQTFNRVLLSKEKEKENENITFSKFVLTELTETIVEIEWIYNYFRLYFELDRTGKDSFGYVEKDPSSGQIYNSTRFFDEEEYCKFIEAQIEYVIMMTEG